MSLFQGLVSLFLVAEIPSYLKKMKVIRAFSFMLACIYNTFWLWSALEVYYGSIQAHMKKKSYNLAMILIDAFWVLNLGFNAPIAMINFVIIFKELSYELSPFRKYFYGGSKEELVLGFGWMWNTFWSVSWYFNPFYWFYAVFFKNVG